MDSNSNIANRTVSDIPASRPGLIAIVVLTIGFGIIFAVPNWKTISGWFA